MVHGCMHLFIGIISSFFFLQANPKPFFVLAKELYPGSFKVSGMLIIALELAVGKVMCSCSCFFFNLSFLVSSFWSVWYE